jgi:hypothetical protein
LDQSCTAHEAENIAEMQQGKEEKTQRIFASNATKLSRGSGERKWQKPRPNASENLVA